MKQLLTLLLFTTLLAPATICAAEAQAEENNIGKALFFSKGLGTSGKTCGSCHPFGEKLEKVDGYNDARLKEIINTCVRDALKGRPLKTDSAEMNALAAYIRSYRK